MKVGIRGAHAPRVPAMAPSPSHSFRPLIKPKSQQNTFRRGAETGTRGACAPLMSWPRAV